MTENFQNNSNRKSIGSPSSLSIGIMIVSFFFAGSLYTRVKILEKELGDYRSGAQVAGAQVEAKGKDIKDNTGSAEVKGEVKITSDDHINGSKKARVFLIEYSDIECPYCKKFHPTAQQIVDNFKGEVAWVYRHLPLPFHANAQKEAEASECANELGGNTAFWKYVNALFKKTNSGGTGFALDDLVPLAKEVGLNDVKFKSCLDSDRYADRVKGDAETAAGLGVDGTPGNILLDTKTGKTKLMPGAYPFEEFKKAIENMLED